MTENQSLCGCSGALCVEKEPRVPNPEPRVPNPESRVPNPESQTAYNNSRRAYYGRCGAGLSFERRPTEPVVSSHTEFTLLPGTSAEFTVFTVCGEAIDALKKEVKSTHEQGFFACGEGRRYAEAKRNQIPQHVKETAAKLLYASAGNIKTRRAAKLFDMSRPPVCLKVKDLDSLPRLKNELGHLKTLCRFDIRFNAYVLYAERHGYFLSLNEALNALLDESGIKQELARCGNGVYLVNEADDNVNCGLWIAGCEKDGNSVDCGLRVVNCEKDGGVGRGPSLSAASGIGHQVGRGKPPPYNSQFTIHNPHTKNNSHVSNRPPPTIIRPCGIGGITSDYAFALDVSSVAPPRPLSNVISNGRIGTVITSAGGGFTFYKNSYSEKITRMQNDAVLDSASELVVFSENGKTCRGDGLIDKFYGKMNVNNLSMSPPPRQVPSMQLVDESVPPTSHAVVHGLGYSEFRCEYNGFFTSQRMYLAPKAAIKFYDIEVENCKDEERAVEVMFAADMVLGDFPHNTVHALGVSSGQWSVNSGQWEVFSDQLKEDGFVSRIPNPESRIKIENRLNGLDTYICCSQPLTGFSPWREAFTDERGNLTPLNPVAEGSEFFPAVKTKIVIPGKGVKRIIFALGEERDVDFLTCDAAYKQAKEFFGNLSSIQMQRLEAQQITNYNVQITNADENDTQSVGGDAFIAPHHMNDVGIGGPAWASTPAGMNVTNPSPNPEPREIGFGGSQRTATPTGNRESSVTALPGDGFTMTRAQRSASVGGSESLPFGISVPVPLTPPPGTEMTARTTAGGSPGTATPTDAIGSSVGAARCAARGPAWASTPTGMNVTIPNPESRIPNPGDSCQLTVVSCQQKEDGFVSRPPNPESRIPNPESRPSDPALDLAILSRWLPYQVYSSRFMARAGYYQAGGAIGFRDQLQDCLALLYVDTALVRGHILTCAARQFEKGDVLHWWHPPAVGVRTRISDDRLWLVYVVCEYIEFTGDAAILRARVPYLTGPGVPEGGKEVYAAFKATEHTATLHEHILRALKLSCDSLGENGLCKMGTGDWNDGMDKVGERGIGTSVFTSMLLYASIQKFLPHLKDTARRGAFLDVCEGLKKAINRAWDGEWFLRAFDDDGRALGSKNCSMGKIDLLVQVWAVLSGAGEEEKCALALSSALARLVDEERGIVKLLTPPYTECTTHNAQCTMKDVTMTENQALCAVRCALCVEKKSRASIPEPGNQNSSASLTPIPYPLSPKTGYIASYPPGVRENGGQYTHAAVWLVLALLKTGQTETAWRIFSLLSPLSHTDTPQKALRYGNEPYVLSADVYAGPLNTGQGGWSWYTGAAAWYYKCLIEGFLGVKIRGKKLSVAPNLPAAIPDISFALRHNGGVFNISIDNTAKKGEWRVKVGSIVIGTGEVDLCKASAGKKITVFRAEA